MKSKILIGSAITAAVMAILAALIWFVPIIKPSSVSVTGLDHLSAEEVEAAAAVDMQQNFLRLDETAIAHNVSELDWVDSVNVRKEFPATVSITVTEHQIAGYEETDGGIASFDADGRIVMYTEEPVGGLLTTDIPADDAAAQQAREAVAIVLAALDPGQVEQLVRVSAPSADEITLITHDERRIFVGTAENLDAKITTLRYALARAEHDVDISGAPIIAVQ